MTLEQLGASKTMTLPQILVNDEQDDFPLGNYGFEIIKYMKENQPERYWELSFDGKLMKTVNRRERELADFKITLMEELEKKFPRPKTDKFTEIAAHMDIIDEQAELVIKQEIIRPI